MEPNLPPAVSPRDVIKACAVALVCILSLAGGYNAAYTAVRDHYLAQQPMPPAVPPGAAGGPG